MYHPRGINVSYRRRIRQIVVLIFTIIMGVLISQASQAQLMKFDGYHENGPKIKNNKTKVHHYKYAHRECRILAQRSHQKPKRKTSLMASNRKPKQKALAEVDPQ